MEKVTLPSGKVAQVLGVDELTAGVKLAIQRAVSMIMQDGKIALHLGITEEVRMAMLAKVVKSLDGAAVAAKDIEDLAIKDYEALVKFTREHAKLLEVSSKDDKSAK